MKSSNASNDIAPNPDGDLRVYEGMMSDLTRRISNSERLIYIYTLTGIIVCTVIVTFCRSFFFFSVDFFLLFNTFFIVLSEIFH